MQRQDQCGVLGNAETFRSDIDSLVLEPIDFLNERMRIYDDTIADDGELSLAHHARRQQR